MSQVKIVTTDLELQAHLTEAGAKLVIIDFTATWCGPCQRIAPMFDVYSARFEHVVFLKVDVDKSPDLAAAHGVSAMPTFILYKNKVKIDRLQGADQSALEAKIKQYCGPHPDDVEIICDIAGHMDLYPFILKDQCTVLNEKEGHCVKDILVNDNGKFLESSTDQQLLFSFTFSQRVKIHSVKIKAPPDSGPRDVKIFANLPGNLDFTSAESLKPKQFLTFEKEDLANGKPVALKYVSFQNVASVDLFIEENYGPVDITRIDYISFIGTPIQATNMEDFKRVAGKKGESH